MRWNRPSLFTRIAAYGGLAFMHVPVLVIVLYAFTTADRTYEFPPPGLTLRWFEAAFARSDIWSAMTLSLQVAALATLFALVLGSLTALAMARTRFFGKEAITVLLVLPIALPGIVTGIALLTAIKTAQLDPGFWTIVAGHTTFLCRDRLQQRDRPLATHARQLDRSVNGSRCRWLADVPPYRATAIRKCLACGRHARICLVVR